MWLKHVMTAYAAMLLNINYAQIHASIIRQGLVIMTFCNLIGAAKILAVWI